MRAWPSAPSLVALILAAAVLPGCSDAPAQADEVSDGPVVVTDPNDFSALLNSTDNQPHLHDYWGGRDRLTILDGGQDDVGPGFSGGGESLVIQEFRPDEGNVVPLGTASLEVTFSWTDETGDLYTAPQLWVKTAADNATWLAANLTSGETFTIASNNERNDLPHQRLSAWIFELRMSAHESGILRFKGETHILAEAVRGIEIPLFPAHPDFWDGAASLPLVETQGFQLYMHDPGDGGCDGVSCRQVHVPADGALVPYDAAWVEATLTFTYDAATELGLAFHGADTRTFDRPAASQADGSTRIYRIPVDVTTADGPYALQSQWEFEIAILGPIEDSLAADEYTLTVVVHKTPMS